MKLFIRNTIVELFLAFFFLGSLGLSFSKISCPIGQHYILGSEMPPRKIKLKHCCEREKGNPINEKDDRKKETFQFQFDCEADNVGYSEITKFELLNPSLPVFEKYYPILEQELLEYNHYRSNPPPLLTKPTLPFLQSYLI